MNAITLFVLLASDLPDSAHQAALRGEIEDAGTEARTTSPRRSPARSEPYRVKTGVVYGYFPAGYTLDQIKGWDELTHIVWFGPTINSSGSMGNSAGLGGATYQALREATRERGIELLIGLVNFNTEANPSSVATLLANRTTAINTIKKLVQDYDADGISLDFEVVPESSKQAYVDFLAAAHAFTHVSSAIPPPTGWKGYDYVGILQNSDLAFVMAYDYYWKGGPKAGPVTPKNDGTNWGPINLTTSLDKLVTQTGDLKTKLVIGLPWYGYSWPTASTNIGSSTVSRPEAPPFAPTCASGRSRIASGSYDNASEQPYAAYYDAYGARQMWLDDAESFAGKMDLVKARGFGGIGMFQIGYEGDAPEFWTAISERYTEIDAPPSAVILAPAQAVVGEEIALDGSSSTDPEGKPLTFAWTTSAGTITNATSAKATIVASAPGTITIDLSVSDGRNASSPAQKQIQILPAEKPKANPVVTPTETTPTTTPEQTIATRGSNIGRPGSVQGGCQASGTPAWLLFVIAALGLRTSRAGGRGRTARSA